MKHTWISGMKLELISERHEQFQGLEWNGEFPPSYSVHIFPNKEDAAGIIALSDAFGGHVSWARYQGKNPMIGKVYETLDKAEQDFLGKSYPELLDAIKNLDT